MGKQRAADLRLKRGSEMRKSLLVHGHHRRLRAYADGFAGLAKGRTWDRLRVKSRPTPSMRKVTILFCDIRGFTRITERLGPERTAEWFGDVMGTLSACVLEHRGALVDFYGDALMAMWGAPEARPDHAVRACRCALEMWNRLPRLGERWRSVQQEPLGVGIGLNTGVDWVGNIGSRQKFKYGPLGNTVNLASRVQGATKFLRCPLLLTEATVRELTAEFHSRELCQARVFNIRQPVRLYQLAVPDQPGWPDVNAKYQRALEEFNQRNFRTAARILGNLLAGQPYDGPAVALLSRVVNALRRGPDEMHPVWDLPGK
jgi:adenylate cyclase